MEERYEKIGGIARYVLKSQEDFNDRLQHIHEAVAGMTLEQLTKLSRSLYNFIDLSHKVLYLNPGAALHYAYSIQYVPFTTRGRSEEEIGDQHLAYPSKYKLDTPKFIAYLLEDRVKELGAEDSFAKWA